MNFLPKEQCGAELSPRGTLPRWIVYSCCWPCALLFARRDFAWQRMMKTEFRARAHVIVRGSWARDSTYAFDDRIRPKARAQSF